MLELEQYYKSKDRHNVYENIKVYLGWGSGEETYEEVSIKTAMSVSSIKIEVSRMRKRYKEILTNNVKQTMDVENDSEVKSELMDLLSCV